VIAAAASCRREMPIGRRDAQSGSGVGLSGKIKFTCDLDACVRDAREEEEGGEGRRRKKKEGEEEGRRGREEGGRRKGGEGGGGRRKEGEGGGGRKEGGRICSAVIHTTTYS